MYVEAMFHSHLTDDNNTTTSYSRRTV